MKIKISTGIFLTVLTVNVIFSLSLCFRDNYTDYSGDHVQDFTLMRFLDCFVYRNLKAPQR